MAPRVEFWSSTEGSAFQQALVRELSAAGCPAGEEYQVSEADYWSARTRWQRLSLRFRTYALYPLQLRRHFARAAPGRMAVVCSNTFYAPWVAIKAAGRSGRVIHWVFDLYPDVLFAGGWRGAGGLREKWLRVVMRQTFDAAAANVFLGENLLRHAEAKFGPIPRAQVIAVGADGGPFTGAEPARTVDTRNGEVLTVLYCGNLGRMHEVDTLIAALPELHDQPLRLRFFGHGTGYDSLWRRTSTLPHVAFGPNLEAAAWVPAMQAAEIALVTLKDSAAGLVMPSKTYSALVAGQAVLAVCPRESDLAELILRHDAGWVIAPGDAPGFVALIQQILQDPPEVLRKRRNAWRAGHAHYSQQVIAARWRELIATVNRAP